MNDGQFTRAFFGMIGGLVLWTIILMILAKIVSSELQANLDVERLEERAATISDTVVKAGEVSYSNEESSTEVAQAATSDAKTPESMYNTSCAACHASGAAGAPILGNKEQWAARISNGNDSLYNNAINGIGAMPPKGGANLSDDEVKAVVDYMTANSK